MQEIIKATNMAKPHHNKGERMSESIIIIESPNKIEKVEKYSGFKTFATKGHFKELSQNIFFKEQEQNYEPEFVPMGKNGNYRENEMINLCRNKEVIIATDPDREGYAIGYMVYESIKNLARSVKRAEFFEITEQGIKKGLENAIPFAQTNFKDFESYKARAVSDKMVGFILSPKYMNKLNDKNISVGRVQTPALNLIVNKELQIKDFLASKENQKIDYKIKALLKKEDKEFIALNDNLFSSKEEALKQIEQLKEEKKAVLFEKESKESKIKPKAPFRTSQFQEAMNKAYGFDSKTSMALAQALFEKGLITYIRTDSNAISQEFITAIEESFKQETWYEKRIYEAGKQSQAEAHEAIRITHTHSFDEIDKIVRQENLSDDERKTYELVFLNSIASQAKDCINENTIYDFNISTLSFKAKITKCLYKGFKELYNLEQEEENEEQELDLNLKPNDEVSILSLECVEVKKQAPARYKESNFISLLEKEGIGRPSTYASFLPVLLQRNYVELEKKGKNSLIKATQKGINFISKVKEIDEWITQSEYTRQMENVLDLISKGEANYLEFIKAIHEKMGFAKINEANNPPSQKSLDYAKIIAQTLKLELPLDIEKDYKICSNFINEYKDKMPKKQSKPSEKQILLVEKLAKEKGLPLPNHYKEDMQICSEFISQQLQKNTKKK